MVVLIQLEKWTVPGSALQNFNNLVSAEEKIKRPGLSFWYGTQQAMNSVWDQEVNRIIMEGEFDKLGVDVSKKNSAIFFTDQTSGRS